MGRRDDEARAFLAAIRACPEDDTPRLVYADWLEDHGDPARAEFIRTQCALARPATEATRAELEARERELLKAHRGEWLGPLARELPPGRCTFRRGFPEALTVRPKAMVERAEEFDARVPAGRVKLYGGFGDPAMKALAACPTLGWVASLEYEHPQVTEAGLAMIGESPNFTHLRELAVEFGNFSLKGLLALTTSPHHAPLRRLHLTTLWLEAERYPYASAFTLPEVRMRLRSLSLEGLILGAEGAASLAGTSNLAQLKELDLLFNGIEDDGAVALARSPYLRGMSELGLQTNSLTARSVRELADSPLIEGVRHLNLGVNEVGDEGAEALAASARLKSLERLDLFSARITDRGAAALAASPNLTSLTELHLAGYNRLTESGSQRLFDSPYLRRLERISLNWQAGSDKAADRRLRKQWKDRLGKGARV